MSSYAEFCKCFRGDDCGKIKELIDECTLLPVIGAAASYSVGQRKLSAGMTRTILVKMLDEIDAYYAIPMLSELLNGDKQHMVSDSVLRLIQQGVIAREETEPQVIKASQRRLIEHVGTCPEPDFDRFLSFVYETNISLVMPDNVTLATLERARRRLKDDRVFFLVLQNSILAESFGNMINNIVATQAITLNQLEELGYTVEAMPGVANAFVVSQADDQSSAMASPQADSATSSGGWHYPKSGTDWVASQRRRGYGRRRKR